MSIEELLEKKQWQTKKRGIQVSTDEDGFRSIKQSEEKRENRELLIEIA